MNLNIAKKLMKECVQNVLKDIDYLEISNVLYHIIV